MTSHWKSNERHYCEICKKWMSGDLKSVRFHENGNSHKYHLDMRMRNKQRERRERDRVRRETEKVVRMAERAAGVKTSSVPFRRRRPNPNRKRKIEEMVQEEEEEEEEEKEDETQYEVDGKIYIQVTESIEKRIGSGVRCEVFSESSDEWLAAKIVSDADLVGKRFRVAFYVPEIWIEKQDQESGTILFYNTESKETQSDRPIVKDVRGVFEMFDSDKKEKQNSSSAEPDRRCRLSTFVESVEYENIRLCPPVVATNLKDVLDLSRLEKEDNDVSAMIGGWETVEIQEQPAITEKKEEEEKVIEFVNAPRVGETDSYKAMNPFGGAYRGVDIEETEKKSTLSTSSLTKTNQDVQFRSKKKKKKKKRRMMKAPSET
jgi:hypothetical protein